MTPGREGRAPGLTETMTGEREVASLGEVCVPFVFVGTYAETGPNGVTNKGCQGVQTKQAEIPRAIKRWMKTTKTQMDQQRGKHLNCFQLKATVF